jgi:pimeloyl-ACP methyl ester carboxylesterase
VNDGASSLVAPLTAALLPEHASLEVRARLRTMIERTRVETYVSALEGMRDREDTSDVLASFDGPVSVMVGEFDKLVSVERNHEIASSAENGIADTAMRSGHLVPMENPNAVARFIRDLVQRQ